MNVNSWLNPIFSPLLQMPSFLAILLISFIVTLITTLAYKYLTDQKRIIELKADLKKAQTKMRELAKTHPDKAMKLQKDMMSKNTEMMKHSLKPTLYTLLPLLLIFGWLNAHMAYEPLMPGEDFTVTIEDQGWGLAAKPDLAISQPSLNEGATSWTVSGDEGDYQLTFRKEGYQDITKLIRITPLPGEYENPKETIDKQSITIGNTFIHPLGETSIFGWHPGWLGTYILLSLLLSFGLRKLLRVA